MLTEEQKELRKTGIGGSDAAPVAGLSRYKSNVDVYLEKLGLAELSGENEASYWGSVLEEIIIKEYMKQNNIEVIRKNELLKSSKYPWMIANIDGYIPEKNAILECKTTNSMKAAEWGEELTDDLPTEYLLQCAHYRIVTDCNFVAIAVLIGGQKYKQYIYEKNAKLEEKLIKAEHDFWHNHVLPQEPPKIKKYEDACKLFKIANETSKKADLKIEEQLKSYSDALMGIKKLKEQADFLKANLAEYLGDSSILEDELGRILATWKNKKTNRFDIETFKKVHPDVYKQFIKESLTREFRLKEINHD